MFSGGLGNIVNVGSLEGARGLFQNITDTLTCGGSCSDKPQWDKLGDLNWIRDTLQGPITVGDMKCDGLPLALAVPYGHLFYKPIRSVANALQAAITTKNYAHLNQININNGAAIVESLEKACDDLDALGKALEGLMQSTSKALCAVLSNLREVLPQIDSIMNINSVGAFFDNEHLAKLYKSLTDVIGPIDQVILQEMDGALETLAKQIRDGTVMGEQITHMIGAATHRVEKLTKVNE